MIRWHTLLRRDVTEHSFLLVIVAAHSLVSLTFLHSDESLYIKVAAEPELFNKLLTAATTGCIHLPIPPAWNDLNPRPRVPPLFPPMFLARALLSFGFLPVLPAAVPTARSGDPLFPMNFRTACDEASQS